MEVFVEAGIVLILFVLGIVTGMFLDMQDKKKYTPPKIEREPLDDALREQQREAVNYLLNYSADIAYGNGR